MRSWKRLISMALAGILTVGCVVGCGTAKNTAERPETGSAASSSDKKQPIITVMTNSMSGENQRLMQKGAILQGQELGYTINILAPNSASNTQKVINNLAEAQTYSDAIVFMSNSNLLEPNEEYLNQIVPALSDVKSAGIPIVMMYYSLDDDSVYDTSVSTNNYRAGRALGEVIAEQQPNAVVGVIQVDSVTKYLKVREKGILEALRENGCTVLDDEMIAEWSWDNAKTLSATMLENHPEMTTIVCVSDWLAQAAAQTVQEASRSVKTEEEQILGMDIETEEIVNTAEPVMVYTIGASIERLKNVLEGTIQVEIMEQSIQIGRDSITLADQLLQGKSVKKNYYTPYVLVTQDNAQALIDEANAQLAQAGLDASEQQ